MKNDSTDRTVSRITLQELLKRPREYAERPIAIVTGIDQPLIDNLYRRAQAFFSSTDKEQFAISDFAGYTLVSGDNDDCARDAYTTDGSISARKFPTPAFGRAMTSVFRAHERLGDAFVGQTTLSVLRYHDQPKLYRIRPHTDEHLTLAFTPRGEPLEAFVEKEWVSPSLVSTEALLVGPLVPHRVRKTQNGERLSITMVAPTSPI